jgi:hypothetical protein
MKALTPGHNYELLHFENPQGAEHIQFIEKKQQDGQIVTVNDGTTNEEVLLMLIDRLIFLNQLLPCRETSLAITKVQEAWMWLDKRTRDRRERGVEGTYKP